MTERPNHTVAKRPEAALARFVSHYWLSLDSRESTFLALPDGCVDIVLEVTPSDFHGWAYGTTTRPTQIACTPGNHYLGIRFKPGQSRHFLRAAADELTDGREDLHALARLPAQMLSERVRSHDLFAQLDSTLVSSLRKSPPGRSYVDEALRIIESSHGNSRLSEVASWLGKSRRQLERAFLLSVGVPFKSYCRIVRVKRAASLILRPRNRVLADIAVETGYADQSHMTRDFTELAGISPGKLSRNDVAFLQYHADL